MSELPLAIVKTALVWDCTACDNTNIDRGRMMSFEEADIDPEELEDCGIDCSDGEVQVWSETLLCSACLTLHQADD